MKKIILSLSVVATLMSCTQHKTAYVDNTVLIQDYHKMKSTEAKFEKKTQALSKELDSVAGLFQNEVREFQQNMNSMSSSDREQRQNELMQKQQMLQQTQQQKSQQLRQESDEAIDSLIDEVKDYVADYGKENGYTYIFGSNESANIMYAKDGLDITEEVLEKLNANAEGTTKKSTEEEASEE